MAFDVSFNPPQFEDDYDGVKMRQFVEEIERLHANLTNGDDVVDDQQDFFIGASLSHPSVTVSSNGSTVILSLEDSGGGDVRFRFGSGVLTLSAIPAVTIALTAGDDDDPTLNFVYVLESTGALAVSTDDWPSETYGPIATVLCQTAADVQADGVYKLHAWTDHMVNDGEGHLVHLNHWIRHQPATWQSGAAITPAVGVGQFDVATTVGEVLQLHNHSYPAFNTGSSSEVLVVNGTTAFEHVGDLTNILTDADGNSMSTKYFNLVFWGVVSETDNHCQLMVNLPTGSYNTESKAITDIDNTAVYTIGRDFVGTGFLIAQLTVRHQAAGGGTWSISQNTDLRGLFPSTSPGGGAIGLTKAEADTLYVPLVATSAYTRNATVVENRTLLASASATTLNNNNVLAALIADLQAKNVID